MQAFVNLPPRKPATTAVSSIEEKQSPGSDVKPDVRHVVKRADEARFEVPAEFLSHSSGFQRWAMVDHTTPGAVHTGFGISELGPGGAIDHHVHSFEETFFMLEGTTVIDTPEAAVELRPGDYGMVPVGVPHSWRNTGK